MNSGRVLSPAAVGGEVEKTLSADGLASTAGCTEMRPASPVICEPLAVIWPVYSELPSVNNGNCGLPLVSDCVVIVSESELTVAVADPTTLSVAPEPLNCNPLLPSAPFNVERTLGVTPAERSTPISSGLALAPFCSGSAFGSVTLTIETCCLAPVVVLV